MLEPNRAPCCTTKIEPGCCRTVERPDTIVVGFDELRDMIVTGESSVNESSTPLDYVVTGAQVLTVTVK